MKKNNQDLKFLALELENKYLDQRESLTDVERGIILKTLQIVNIELEKDNA